MAHVIINRYVHANNDELSDMWDFDAPQQSNYHYVLYETQITLDVDLDTGNANIIRVNGIDLVEPVKA